MSGSNCVRDVAGQVTVDPGNLRFIFQGMWDKDKTGNSDGQCPWRIGMLTPVVD
jgi:hypothetical protein